MPTITLTVNAIEKLRPPARGREEWWDEGRGSVRGLGLRITATGAKSWTVLYRHNGRLRRLTLGAYPALGLADARNLARRALRDAALGHDPAGAKRETREAETIGALVERYIRERCERKGLRTAGDYRWIFAKHVLPKWRHRKAAEIRRTDVRELHAALADTPVMANRVVSRVSSFFNWLINEEIVAANPALRIDRYKEEARTRILTDAEVVRLWNACADVGHLGSAFRLLLLTGARANEVIQMRWEELDERREWWTLPDARSKNKRDHLVPLVSAAQVILADLGRQPRTASVWVFPGQRGGPVVAYRDTWVKACELAEIAGASPHDLRRTVATGLAALGVSRFILKRVLNHIDADVTDRYDRYLYADEKREALTRWANRIEVLLTGRATPAKVRQLRA